MYSVILYSLFILFWIAIIYDFTRRPKDRDDNSWSEFLPLRKLARAFLGYMDSYCFVIYIHC